MKTITLTEAIKTATKGQVHWSGTKGNPSGRCYLVAPEGMAGCCVNGFTENAHTAALLAHWYNIGPELVDQLDGLIEWAKCLNNGTEMLPMFLEAKALLTRADSVQIPD